MTTTQNSIKLKNNSLTEEQFNKLTSYLAKKYGLRIPKEKKMMLESRFYRRMNILQLSSTQEYISLVFKDNSLEYQYFIDLVTTHKTFFFREDYQFNFLNELIQQKAAKGRSNESINIWSAGCSTGEEVYTLGIVLQELKKNLPIEYKIVGTDISKPALEKASKGIYQANEIKDLPIELRDKYFKETLTGIQTEYTFKNPEVINRIKLGAHNLNNTTYNLPMNFDYIFCRNVIIYFDLETQRKVMEKLLSKLKPGGYLFLGHSETAIGSSLPIKSIRPTIYQKL